MVAISQTIEQNTLRRIQQIQAITILWMSVEAGVSLFAAWQARSPALLAFGGDSAVELLSATVVLWRFRSPLEHSRAEKNASRIAGVLLFAVVAYVILVSVLILLGHNESRPTYMGIAILVAAAAVMPWLAKEKQKLSVATGSAALRADAAQSGLCAYLSLIALLAGAQVACFVFLTHLEPNFFLIHLYQSILYIAILVMLFYMEDRWAYMIGMVASVVWLVMAYGTGILGSSMQQIFERRSTNLTSSLVSAIALITALFSILMIVLCARHWKKEYAGLGKGRSTFLVSLGVVTVYYGILIALFWEMIPNA
jgi:hypothetical protein